MSSLEHGTSTRWILYAQYKVITIHAPRTYRKIDWIKVIVKNLSFKKSVSSFWTHQHRHTSVDGEQCPWGHRSVCLLEKNLVPLLELVDGWDLTSNRTERSLVLSAKTAEVIVATWSPSLEPSAGVLVNLACLEKLREVNSQSKNRISLLNIAIVHR